MNEGPGSSACVHVVISGCVQGVGYRAWTEHEALRRGLEGWARNRSDGSVEAMFAGGSEAVAAMIAMCRTGPAAARVTDIAQRRASDAERRLLRKGERFSVLPTV